MREGVFRGQCRVVPLNRQVCDLKVSVGIGSDRHTSIQNLLCLLQLGLDLRVKWLQEGPWIWQVALFHLERFAQQQA
jgi:hypothetical protein